MTWKWLLDIQGKQPNTRPWYRRCDRGRSCCCGRDTDLCCGVVRVGHMYRGERIYEGVVGVSRKFKVISDLVLGWYAGFVILVNGDCSRVSSGGLSSASKPRWLVWGNVLMGAWRAEFQDPVTVQWTEWKSGLENVLCGFRDSGWFVLG